MSNMQFNVWSEFQPLSRAVVGNICGVEEIDILVKKVISETNAESMKDMGKVMGMLKELTSGKADAGYISSEVKKALS